MNGGTKKSTFLSCLPSQHKRRKQSCLRLKRLEEDNKSNSSRRHRPEKPNSQQTNDNSVLPLQIRKGGSLAVQESSLMVDHHHCHHDDNHRVERGGSKLKLKRQQPKTMLSSSPLSSSQTHSTGVGKEFKNHFLMQQDIRRGRCDSLAVSNQSENDHVRRPLCSEGNLNNDHECKNKCHKVDAALSNAVECYNPTKTTDQGGKESGTSSPSSSDTTVLQSTTVPSPSLAIPSKITNTNNTLQNALPPSSTSLSPPLSTSTSLSLESQLESIYTIAMQQAKLVYQKHLQQIMELQYKTQNDNIQIQQPTSSSSSSSSSSPTTTNMDLVNQVTSLQRQVATLQKSLVEMRSKYELEKKRVQSVKRQHKLTMNKLGVKVNEKGEVILKLPLVGGPRGFLDMDLDSQRLDVVHVLGEEGQKSGVHGMGNHGDNLNVEDEEGDRHHEEHHDVKFSQSSSEETVDHGSGRAVVTKNVDWVKKSKDSKIQHKDQDDTKSVDKTMMGMSGKKNSTMAVKLQEEDYSPSQVHFSICMDHEGDDDESSTTSSSMSSSPTVPTVVPTTAIKKSTKEDGRNHPVRKVTPYASRKDGVKETMSPLSTLDDHPSVLTELEGKRHASLPNASNATQITTKANTNLSIHKRQYDLSSSRTNRHMNDENTQEEEEEAIVSSPILQPQQRQEQDTHKYQEVIRGKKQREKLHGHDCECCKGFYDALLSGKGGQVFNREELIQQNSRHRSRYAQVESTPKDFWEMSFTDSIAERKERSNGPLSSSSLEESDFCDEENEEGESKPVNAGGEGKRKLSSQDQEMETMSPDSCKKSKASNHVDLSQSQTQIEHSIAY